MHLKRLGVLYVMIINLKNDDKEFDSEYSSSAITHEIKNIFWTFNICIYTVESREFVCECVQFKSLLGCPPLTKTTLWYSLEPTYKLNLI